MLFENNSMTTPIEPWFIPLDIIMIICIALVIGLSLVFLTVIVLDKTCHTIPMMLVANSCLSELMFASVIISMSIFTLQNDLKQINSQDSFCIFRGFIVYIGCCLQNYSYLVQAIYRYIVVAYPTHLFYQSLKFQAFLICLKWIFAIVCPIPYLLTNQIEYNVDNQICQMPLRLSFLAIYNVLCVYLVPINLIILIYFKLVRYVQNVRENVTTQNTLIRAQQELKMVRRIVVLTVGVTIIGFPYAIFIIQSFFTIPPKYHFRIAYLFIDVSLIFVMITLLQFTEPLKKSLLKKN